MDLCMFCAILLDVLFKVWLYVRLGIKTFEIAMSSSEFMGRESKMTSISDNVLSLDVLSCLFWSVFLKNMEWSVCDNDITISLFYSLCLYVHAYSICKKEERRKEKSLMINLLLLKQSKCKLDFSICMFQEVMRFEFKWPACISSTLRAKFKEKRLQHKQTEIIAVIELQKTTAE